MQSTVSNKGKTEFLKLPSYDFAARASSCCSSHANQLCYGLHECSFPCICSHAQGPYWSSAPAASSSTIYTGWTLRTPGKELLSFPPLIQATILCQQGLQGDTLVGQKEQMQEKIKIRERKRWQVLHFSYCSTLILGSRPLQILQFMEAPHSHSGYQTKYNLLPIVQIPP